VVFASFASYALHLLQLISQQYFTTLFRHFVKIRPCKNFILKWEIEKIKLVGEVWQDAYRQHQRHRLQHLQQRYQ